MQGKSIELYRMQRRESLRRSFLTEQSKSLKPTELPRRMPRAQLALALTITDGDASQDATTHDVSSGGCGFYVNNALEHTSIRLALQLPNGDEVRCLGTIVATIARQFRIYVCVRFDAIVEPHPGVLEDVVLETLLASAEPTAS